MTKEQSSELCTSCGLCCYAFHNLGFIENEDEKSIIEGFGGELFYTKNGKLSFKQPCPAFNGICSVYPNHPTSCKEYQCKLVKMLRQNEIDFDKAKRIIKNLKKEVEIIDSDLESLLGKRTTIVEYYIEMFFDKNIDMNTKYKDLLIHFGIYTYLKNTYFNNDSNTNNQM